MSHDAEMDAAMARIGVLRLRLDEKEAELTNLKTTADRFEIENSILMKETKRLEAEVESLMTNPTSRLLRAEREENARLKAEVERLEHQVNYWRIEAETDNARWLRCLEDKDRLTKAGDAMEVLIVEELAFYEDDGSHYDEVKAWSDAKGGKQS